VLRIDLRRESLGLPLKLALPLGLELLCLREELVPELGEEVVADVVDLAVNSCRQFGVDGFSGELKKLNTAVQLFHPTLHGLDAQSFDLGDSKASEHRLVERGCQEIPMEGLFGAELAELLCN
jgi:hypothetical protein